MVIVCPSNDRALGVASKEHYSWITKWGCDAWIQVCGLRRAAEKGRYMNWINTLKMSEIDCDTDHAKT